MNAHLYVHEHIHEELRTLGVSVNDLALPLEEWSGFLLGGPAVATNLTSQDPMWHATPFRDKEVRGRTVRVASLLLDELPETLRGDDAPVQRTEAAPAWAAALTMLYSPLTW